MIISTVSATAVLASVAGAGVQAVQAAQPYLVAGVETVGAPTPLQQVQYFYAGRNYCWYGGGWRGPGYYWCGYAWRRGFGWGGGYGWRGWGPPVWRGPGWRGPGWHAHGWRRY
jgi:hypothetical protein